ATEQCTEYYTKIREAFKVFDRDGNGFISKQELGMAMRSLGYMPNEVELEVIIQRLDMDGDGQVDFEEFVTLLGPKLTASEIREAFKVFDRDGNGFISKQELGMAMRSLGYMPNEVELEVIIQRLDMDGDGQVDFEEFVTLLGPKLTASGLPDKFNGTDFDSVFWKVNHILMHLVSDKQNSQEYYKSKSKHG
uniref:Calcium-binding protein 7-like n=1 Tax=Gouania willdenowi TaxID=441366 RepID=A0A8C5GN18_GOUWI